MALTKAKGNMYGWCSHTHSHLRGKCPHGCSYCYVQAMERRYGTGRYAGELRLDEASLKVKYGTGKTIFIDHCNDLFAEAVPEDWIIAVFEQCKAWPDNTYVFQSKNPARMMRWRPNMPPNVMLGMTVETDDDALSMSISETPQPTDRICDWIDFFVPDGHTQTFITVEPILRMRDPVAFARDIAACKPGFVNVGADSKGTGLGEPSAADVRLFLDELAACGVTVRQKTNLERIINTGREAQDAAQEKTNE